MGISLANLSDYEASARYYVRALALNPRATAGEHSRRGRRQAGRGCSVAAPGRCWPAALSFPIGRWSRFADPPALHSSTHRPPACSVGLPAHLSDLRGAPGPDARGGLPGSAGAAKGAAPGVKGQSPVAAAAGCSEGSNLESSRIFITLHCTRAPAPRWLPQFCVCPCKFFPSGFRLYLSLTGISWHLYICNI